MKKKIFIGLCILLVLIGGLILIGSCKRHNLIGSFVFYLDVDYDNKGNISTINTIWNEGNGIEYTGGYSDTPIIFNKNNSIKTEPEYLEINPLYPSINYNSNDIDLEELSRFRKIMSRIPNEYFKDIEYISLTNKQHPNKIYKAYIYCENYKCHIRQYELMYLTDDVVYNLLLHELGHKFEYKELAKHHGDNEIFEEGGLSEAYAENWRKQHGGNGKDCYSSDRTIC